MLGNVLNRPFSNTPKPVVSSDLCSGADDLGDVAAELVPAHAVPSQVEGGLDRVGVDERVELQHLLLDRIEPAQPVPPFHLPLAF